jgi:hypothetical protein
MKLKPLNWIGNQNLGITKRDSQNNTMGKFTLNDEFEENMALALGL